MPTGKGRSDSSLNQDQREQKIDVCPSLLEYFTYIFNFHSFLAGPCFSIKDFLAFMDGSNLKPLNNPNQFAKVGKAGKFTLYNLHPHPFRQRSMSKSPQLP